MKGRFLAAAATLLFCAPAHADSVLGLTDQNSLVWFETGGDAAGSPLAVTGLQQGETLLAIDRMPGTFSLFGLTSTRIYRIDDTTGVATAITAPGAFSLSGTSFDIDFTPNEFRIRVVSNSGQNFRVNPFTGAIAAIDQPMAYAAGDINAGKTPNIVAIARTENYFGATSPTLYGIDADLDVFVRVVGNNVLETVGALGFDASDVTGFDVSGSSGRIYMVTTAPGASASTVHRAYANYSKTATTRTIGGSYTIVDIAAFAVPEPATWAMMIAGFGAIGGAARAKRRQALNRASI